MELICGINPVLEALAASSRNFDRLLVVSVRLFVPCKVFFHRFEKAEADGDGDKKNHHGSEDFEGENEHG